jgi:hypothetical protein
MLWRLIHRKPDLWPDKWILHHGNTDSKKELSEKQFMVNLQTPGLNI